MHWLNPDHLPHVTSNVERFLLNLRGHADGLILTNGMEVHFPPHLSREICAAIRPGDRVTAYGVQPRSAQMIAAVAIETPAGQRIADQGPPEHKKKNAPKKGAREEAHEDPPRKMEAAGVVQRALHGPKGEIRGALLEDGTIVRFPPKEAGAIAELLSVGALLAVRGEGRVNELGTVIEAHEIGPSKKSLRPVKPKKPKHDRPHSHDGANDDATYTT